MDLVAELDTHQVKGLTPRTVFIGVGFVFELLQGLASRGLSGRDVHTPTRCMGRASLVKFSVHAEAERLPTHLGSTACLAHWRTRLIL